MEEYRKGTIVQAQERLNASQIEEMHRGSLAILEDPGIICHNEHAADLLDKAGCTVRSDSSEQSEDEGKVYRISIPGKLVEKAIRTAPSKVVLGARDPKKRLALEAETPRLYFGTGSETNIYLETDLKEFTAKDNRSESRTLAAFRKERGSISRLCESAKLCNALPNVDFFIRNVNIQDQDIGYDNKDVNVFTAALLFMTKHVQAGLVNLDKLDTVLKLAEIFAGGREALQSNPLVSFITCLIKSPLQMVEDTTEKLIHIAKREVPVVISSSPQGGSTAPIREEGMVALINAEILAGITLAQISQEGAPVLYGAVPVRARLDTLHDMYGAPEFIHYNTDCVQMARHYKIPCYSTAGVADATVPGIQATVEKLFGQLAVAASGAQYIHYCFGLLDKTSIFSPLQAVLDDTHVGMVRKILEPAHFDKEEVEAAVKEVRKVMGSSNRLFARHIRSAIRKGLVSPPYPFESDSEDRVLENAYKRLQEILQEGNQVPDKDQMKKVFSEVPGVMAPNRFGIKL